jgi:hypothetical protein
MLESAAWNSAGLPVEVCYKKTVAFVPIADSKATERKPAKGFPGEYTQNNSRIKEAVSGRRAFGAEAVLDPARREKEVQSPGPPAKRRTRQTLRIRSSTIQVHLSGINKKRDHGPIMARDGGPRNQMPAR